MNTLDTSLLIEVKPYMYYDGPVMGLYQMPDGVKYMGLWSDVIDQETPKPKEIWLFAEMDEATILGLEGNMITTREVLACTPNLYSGENGCHWRDTLPAEKITWDDVAEDCRPAENSFLSSP